MSQVLSMAVIAPSCCWHNQLKEQLWNMKSSPFSKKTHKKMGKKKIFEKAKRGKTIGRRLSNSLKSIIILMWTRLHAVLPHGRGIENFVFFFEFTPWQSHHNFFGVKTLLISYRCEMLLENSARSGRWNKIILKVQGSLFTVEYRRFTVSRDVSVGSGI